MGRGYEREDETYVDDQRCGNCKWWNRDIFTDNLKCGCRGSEKRGRQTTAKDWCWCWKKETWNR